MCITQIEGAFPQDPIRDMEKRQEFVDGWEAAPERFKKWYMEWEPRTQPSIEAAVNIADWNETGHYVDDAIGMCAYVSSFRGQFGGRIPYHLYNLPSFISLATGIDIDTDKLWEIAARSRTLIRAINNRRGLRRKDEKPPEDHWKYRDPDVEKQLLDEYYKFKGWNKDAIPTRQKLNKLGLDYVAEDLIKRGILTDNESDSSKEAPAAKKEKN
jgi:aldehyde:ferredoxin oxidoreductase